MPCLELVSAAIIMQWCFPFARQHIGRFASVVPRSDAARGGRKKHTNNVMEKNRHTVCKAYPRESPN